MSSDSGCCGRLSLHWAVPALNVKVFQQQLWLLHTLQIHIKLPADAPCWSSSHTLWDTKKTGWEIILLCPKMVPRSFESWISDTSVWELRGEPEGQFKHQQWHVSAAIHLSTWQEVMWWAASVQANGSFCGKRQRQWGLCESTGIVTAGLRGQNPSCREIKPWSMLFDRWW